MNISQLHSSGRRASDMGKVLTTCFRFNMDNPEHAKAWDSLHNYDKDKIKSTNVAAIMPVNQFSCERFVARGGRIPAPIHSFKN